MNSIHLHLILVHLSIVIMPVGALILAVGFAKSSSVIRTTGLLLLLFAGLMVVPADLTGEASEEKVEHLAGVQERTIKEHEEAAEVAMVGGLLVSAIVLFALTAGRVPAVRKFEGIGGGAALLAGVFVSAILMRVGYLGGQIRHPEAYEQGGSASAGEGSEASEGESDDD